MMQPLLTPSHFLEALRRITPYINHTPLLSSHSLDKMYGCEVLFKCENFQKVGAYKARGATNKLLQLLQRNPHLKGVCTHSSGNHGQALAYISGRLSVPCYVVMPLNSPEVKRSAVKQYGATVVDAGNTQKEREQTTERVRKEFGVEFVHPYNDLEILTGAGTAALEMFQQIEGQSKQKPLDYIFFPIGGGGLASGTLLATTFFSPKTKKIGVEPYLARDAYLSIKENSIHTQLPPKSIADGLRTSLGDITFPIIRDNVEEIVLVQEGQIVDAMKDVLERMKIVIEPSSATVLAAVKKIGDKVKGKRVGVIISGGNVEFGEFFDGLKRKFKDQQ